MITPLIDSALESVKQSSVDVLIDGTELKGWELRAAWDDIKIGLKHNKLNKIAIYGNKNLQQISVKIGNWFISGEIKYFSDLSQVTDWLKTAT